jgi:hypothetical protein
VKKLSLLKLAFKQLLKILGILAWCMGIILMNENDKTLMIQSFNANLSMQRRQRWHLMGAKVHQKHPI